MAFCTTCGATMDPNSHFCTKCGKSVTPSAGAPAAAAAPATYTPAPTTRASGGGGGAMKVVLIVVGVFVVIGVFALAGLFFVAKRMQARMHNGIHVSQNGDNSVVETPFGRAVTTKGADAKTVARQIGIDLYPGSQGGETSLAQFGKMTTANIKLTTTDSVDQVAKFYTNKFPNAMVSEKGNDKFTLVGSDHDGTITIAAESTGSGTKIDISKVGGLKINVSNQSSQ